MYKQYRKAPFHLCLFFLLSILVFAACKKDDPTPELEPESLAIQVTNLKVDDETINGSPEEPAYPEYPELPETPECEYLGDGSDPECDALWDAWNEEYNRLEVEYYQLIQEMTPIPYYWLYSLEEGRVISPDRANTNEWDIALMVNVNTSKDIIFVNNGQAEESELRIPGEVLGALLPVAFEDLSEAPDPSEGLYNILLDQNGINRFPDNPTSRIAWNGDLEGNIGWWPTSGYGQDQIVNVISDRTFVIRTTKGNYAKFQMQSVYKDSPANPTVDSEKYYLTFRYYVQRDGSRNLQTSQ